MNFRPLLRILFLLLAAALGAPPIHAERTRLRLPLAAAPRTLDPAKADDPASIEITGQLFLGLTELAGQDAQPALATRWEVSPDGRTYTFFLRPALWSDGAPVVADDIVFAAQRNLAPGSGAFQTPLFFIIHNAERWAKAPIPTAPEPSEALAITALNDQTLQITLDHPAPYFPVLAALGFLRPLPRQTARAHPETWSAPESLITNGPYRLDALASDGTVRLSRNPTYFDASRVAIAEVEYRVIAHSALGWVHYREGRLDVLGGHNYLPLPPLGTGALRDDTTLVQELRFVPMPTTDFLAFNTQRPPMDHPKVRRALSAAIDRRVLVQHLPEAGFEPAATLMRPLPGPESLPDPALGFDPLLARRLLSEAGYPEGKGFPVLVLMHNTSLTHARAMETLRGMWRETLGVKTQVLSMDWERFLKTLEGDKAPHVFRFGWRADYPDPNNWLLEGFHPTRSQNLVRWENAEFARLTEQALSAQSAEERRGLYHQAERILLQDAAVIAPLYFQTRPMLVKPYLNPSVSAWGGHSLKDWRFKD